MPEEWTAQSRIIQAVERCGQRLGREVQPAELFELVVEETAHLLEADAVVWLQAGESNAPPSVTASRGLLPGEPQLFQVLTATAQKALAQGQSVLDNRLPDADAPADAIMAVPLRHDGQVLAALAASCRRRHFNQDDLQLLEEIAKKSATALGNARVFQDLTRRVEELSGLLETVQAMASTLDLNAVLGRIAAQALKLLASDDCKVYLLEEDGHTLHPVAAEGETAQAAIQQSIQVDSSFTGVGIRTLESQIFNDALGDPRGAYIEGTPVEQECVITAPLLVKGRVIGGMTLNRMGSRYYTTSDLRLLTGFASQAAVAIENARLYESTGASLARQADEMAVLEEISLTVGSSPSLETALASILASIRRLVWYDIAEITLWDPERQVLITRSSVGGEGRYKSGNVYALDEGLTGWLARHRQPLRVDDIVARQDVQPKSQPLDRPFRSYVGIPLESRGNLVGTMEMIGYEPGRYTERDVDILQLVGRQAAIAIENAKLFSAAQERLTILSSLHEISQTIGTMTEPAQVYGQLCERIAQLMQVEMTGVLLYDAERQVLASQLPFYGVSQDFARYYNIPVTAGTAFARIWREAPYWMSNDVYNDPMADEAGLTPLALAAGVRRTILAPMTVGSERIGIIQATNRLDERLFTEEDARLLCIFANQAAAVIQNARLFAESRQRAEQQAVLARVAALSATTLDLDAMLDQIVAEVLPLFQADLAALLLVDDEHQEMSARYLASTKVERQAMESFRVALDSPGFENSIFVRGGSYFCNDALNDPSIVPAYRPHIQQLGIQNFVGVVLRVREQSFGEFYIANRPDGFGSDDVRLLRTVGGYVANAIENAQLFQQTQQRAAELSLLAEVSATLNSTLDPDEVFRTIISSLRQVVRCDRSAIFVRDEVADVLYLTTSEGLSEQYAERSAAVPIDGKDGRMLAVTLGKPVVVADIEADPQWQPLLPMAQAEGFRAFADLPLVRGERVIGLLSALYEQPHTFTSLELELLNALANQAAVAVENARLYAQTDEELQRRMLALASLQRISRELNATLDKSHILQIMLEEALKVSGATHGAINLGQRGSQTLQLQICSGYTDEEQEHIRANLRNPDKNSALGVVLRTQQTVVIDDAEDVEWTTSVRADTRSALLVPVFYEGLLSAIIFLGSNRSGTFTPEIREFVESLAEQAATAIGNAQRFQEQQERGEQLRQRTEQLTMLLEVSHTIRSDRPLQDVLQEISYAIQETAGFNVVLISVTEGDPPVLLRRVAGAGVPVADLERLRQTPQAWGNISPVLRERFRVSQSYYVPAEEQQVWRGRIDVYEPIRAGERLPGRWHPHDLLIVPLRGASNQMQGIISVDQPMNGEVPSQVVIEVLEIFASQAAVAIENAHLVEVLQRRADTLALFNELSRSVTAKLDLDAVLATVVQSTVNLLSCRSSIVFLFDANADAYVARAAHGLDMAQVAELRFRVREGLVGTVGGSGMPITIDDTSQETHPMPGATEPGAAILVPLMVGTRVMGVLTAASSRVESFTPTDVGTLLALADQVAVAVDNARLFEEVRNFTQVLEQRVEERTQALAEAMSDLTAERDRVSILYRITSELAASLDLERVLNRALMLVGEAVGTDQGMVLLMDPQTNRLALRARLGPGDRLPPGGIPTEFRRNEGLVGWVMSHRQSTIVADAQKGDLWKKLPVVEAQSYRSVLATPLMTGDEVLGALVLLHTEVGHFTNDQLKLVEAAATQVSNAVNNSALYGLIRDQAERLGTMLKAQQVEAAKSGAILEGVADGVLFANSQGEVLLFNAAGERILGLPRDRVIGRRIEEMLGLYGGQARSWMHQMIEWESDPDSYDGRSFLSERLEIGPRVVSVHLAPVMLRGEFLGTVSVFRDITAEVEAERAKSEFVATVSHELRTPMTSIKGYADLLLMGAVGELSQQQRGFIQIVKNNADRLTTLVNDLLDISRIETGRVHLDMKPIPVAGTVDTVISTLRRRAEEKSITLTSQVKEALPLVVADQDRVVQILTNLVANAIHYTPNGGQVVVSAAASRDTMQIDVTDTGIGIAPENLTKVFDRFFRADHPLVHEVPGTGLGLPIVKSLVDMHHGTIWVTSEIGKGSTFSFTLPLEKTGEPAPEETAAAENPSARADKILVVEDEPDIANLIRIHLASDDRQVLLAMRGEEALEQALSEQPDLITLDICLPDMDGFALAERLRHDPRTRNIPVLIVSVLADEESKLRIGAVDYVSKPIDEHVLLQAVQRVLDRRGRVLIVDDDPDTLALMREVLEKSGFDVDSSRRGVDALRLARDNHPALILLDLKLPDIDGYEVLTRLKATPATREIPVMIMTGSLTDEELKRAKVTSLGAERLMAKPFAIEDLIREIENLLRRNVPSATEAV